MADLLKKLNFKGHVCRAIHLLTHFHVSMCTYKIQIYFAGLNFIFGFNFFYLYLNCISIYFILTRYELCFMLANLVLSRTSSTSSPSSSSSLPPHLICESWSPQGTLSTHQDLVPSFTSSLFLTVLHLYPLLRQDHPWSSPLLTNNIFLPIS